VPAITRRDGHRVAAIRCDADDDALSSFKRTRAQTVLAKDVHTVEDLAVIELGLDAPWSGLIACAQDAAAGDREPQHPKK
jgi:hypothetical protein